MVRWEYQIIRMDTLRLFQMHLESLGKEGWELVAAQYAIHAEERPEIPPGTQEWTQSKVVPPRPVWLGWLKRKIDDSLDGVAEN